MASDNEDGWVKDKAKPYWNMLQTTISLAPMGVGAYFAWQNVESNAPLGVRGLLGPPNLEQSSAIKAGRKLHSRIGKANRDKGRRARQIAEQILNDGELDKLWQVFEERKALLATVLATIDDPSSGLDSNQLQSTREVLFNAIESMSGDEDQVKEVVKKAVMSITDSGSPRLMGSFASYFDEFKALGPQLSVPNLPLKNGIAIQEIGFNDISPEAQRRYKKLSDETGQKFKIHKVMERDGIYGIYARVEVPGSGGTIRFKTNVPLDLSRAKRFGAAIYRSGEEYQTAYHANRGFVSAERLHRHLQDGGRPDFRALTDKGIAHGFEDVVLHEVLNYHRTAGSVAQMSKVELGSTISEYLAATPRVSSMLGKSQNPEEVWFAEHLGKSRFLAHQKATIYGIESLPRSVQEQFPQIFVKYDEKPVEGWDPGVPAGQMFTRTEEGRILSTIGLTSNQLKHLKTGGTTDRFSFPITARDSQMVGREDAFLEGPTRSLGRSFKAGHNVKNIEWSNAVTGASNRAVLLDVTRTNRLGLEGMGEAYSVRGARVRSAITKPVLNPTTMKTPGGAILEKIMQAHAKDPNALVHFTREELVEFGGFLGMGDQGIQRLRMDPYMEKVALGIEQISKDGTRVHLAGYMDKRIDDGTKFFSTLFKGTQKRVTKTQLNRMLGEFGMVPSDLKRLGIDVEDVLVTTGDMLRKAPDILNIQMISGLGMVKQMDDPFETIATRARGSTYGVLGNHKVAKVTEAVISELAEGKVNARDAGRVLAGIWHYGGTHRGYEVEQKKLEGLIRQVWGRDEASKIVEIAKKGFAIGGTSTTAGPQPGGWGMSRGSIEPRTLKMLQQRLRTMGMDEDQVSDFIADILNRKTGISANMTVVEGFKKMQASLIGHRGVLDQLNQSAQRLTVKDVRDMVNRGTSLAEYLREAKEGVLLDLDDLDQTPGAERVRYEARKAFGGQAQVYLPGGEFLDELRGSVIRSSGQSKEISHRYLGYVEGLGQELSTLGSSPHRAQDAEKVFGRFREEMTRLTAGSMDQIVRGKIRGSQFLLGQSYNLEVKHFLTGQQKAKVRRALGATRGQAVFTDSLSFLSMLNDFMGNSPGKVKDVAEMLERFYTSMESGKMRGVASLMGRHPNLSMGHAAPVQLFRHAKEAGLSGDNDQAFRLFKQTRRGTQAIRDLERITGGTVSSFSDVAKARGKHSTAVRGFFEQFAGALSGMVDWDGEGMLYVPQIDSKIQFSGGRSHDVSFSASGAMIGDFDGDKYSIMLMGRKHREQLLGVMQDKKLRDNYMRMDTRYKVASTLFMEEAKTALKQRAAETALKGDNLEEGFYDIERVFQDVQKERGMKQVGQLDVKLNTLRSAMIRHGGVSNDQVNMALAMLKNIEEFASIKGKKQDIFTDYATQISDSVDHLFKTGDIGRFRDLIQNTIYKGSQLFSEDGMEVTGWNISDAHGDTSYITRDLKGMQIRGAELFDALQTVARQTIEAGNLQELETAARTMAQLTRGQAHEAFHSLAIEGATMPGGIHRGYQGDLLQAVEAIASGAGRNMKNAAAKLDKAAMTPLALGAIGSMMISSLMGDTGYGPEPLTMPGEVVSAEVRSGIARGNLFQPRDSGPTAQDLRAMNQPQAQMHGRVIHQPTTYLDSPGGYQIRGELSSSSGFDAASGMMSQLVRGGGGAGAITINDRRRPLTQNYLDRLLGEY